jgi:RNA-directed DNA polymerase
MMNGREKSDPAIVAAKQANKAGQSAAEPVERRAGAKGNAGQEHTLRTQGREGASQGLNRVRQAARLEKETRFTALLHHVDVDRLREAFHALKRDAAAGVDGLTWRDYETDLDSKLADLCDRVHKGGPYHPLPSRRRFIPKADGRQRPLAVAAVEDKIVQRAVQEVLNALLTRRTSSGSRMGSGRDAARMTRWTPSSSESARGK